MSYSSHKDWKVCLCCVWIRLITAYLLYTRELWQNNALVLQFWCLSNALIFGNWIINNRMLRVSIGLTVWHVLVKVIHSWHVVQILWSIVVMWTYFWCFQKYIENSHWLMVKWYKPSMYVTRINFNIEKTNKQTNKQTNKYNEWQH